jgi:hypothetical protein
VARAEGLATERDKEAVREGARHLEEAGDFREAGAAWELLGDDAGAAKAFERGGLVDLMEEAIARDEKRARAGRRVKGAFEEYQLHLAGGDRESALAALRACCDAAEQKGEYRRLLEDLEARRIAGGSVSLRRREKIVVVCAGEKITIGRDAGCSLVLRSGGVSRVHAELHRGADGTFTVRDAGSRHGTWIAGMPIAGAAAVALADQGKLMLGEDTELAVAVRGGALRLEVARGLDKGVVLVHGAPDARIDLREEVGLPVRLTFTEGRPYLEATGTLRLNGGRTTHAVQLCHRDVVAVDGEELEVL